MARNGLFNARDRDADSDDAGTTRTMRMDRDGNNVDDRTETRASAPVATRDAEPVTERKASHPTSTTYRPADRGTAPDVVPAPTATARASMAATLGLMLGLVGTAAALTGR